MRFRVAMILALVFTMVSSGGAVAEDVVIHDPRMESKLPCFRKFIRYTTKAGEWGATLKMNECTWAGGVFISGTVTRLGETDSWSSGPDVTVSGEQVCDMEKPTCDLRFVIPHPPLEEVYYEAKYRFGGYLADGQYSIGGSYSRGPCFSYVAYTQCWDHWSVHVPDESDLP